MFFARCALLSRSSFPAVNHALLAVSIPCRCSRKLRSGVFFAPGGFASSQTLQRRCRADANMCPLAPCQHNLRIGTCDEVSVRTTQACVVQWLTRLTKAPRHVQPKFQFPRSKPGTSSLAVEFAVPGSISPSSGAVLRATTQFRRIRTFERGFLVYHL